MTKRGMAVTLARWSLAAALVGTMVVGCGDDDVAPGVDAGPPDAGPPARCAPEPSGDTRWAQYPMPGTPGHARSYQITGAAGAETVIDCVTGLEWQRDVPADTYTQAEAVAYCDGLTLAGYTDWRLPSRMELVTLVDYLVAGPSINVTTFPGTPGEAFWSVSSVAGSLFNGWYVYFDHGSASSYLAPYGGSRARCVRGNDTINMTTGAPPGHFTDLGDGTVRDNLTGLVWQQGFSPSPQSQTESVTYCSTLTVPSGGGWRLPTVAELQTLVDETVSSPSIDTAYFPSTPGDYFWASSSVAGSPSIGWSVRFSDGDAGYNSVAPNSSARCVR